MGIINRNFLYALIYKDSHTFQNIKKNREMVANFVLDPLIYVKTAFVDLDSSFFRSDEEVPVLTAAYAWVEFACTILERPTQKTALVKLLPRRSVILNRPISSVNRAFYAVLEATIHGTRYKTLKDPKYRECVPYYERIVRKCGGRQELEAFLLLKEYLA
jgi:hypothetical protein